MFRNREILGIMEPDTRAKLFSALTERGTLVLETGRRALRRAEALRENRERG